VWSEARWSERREGDGSGKAPGQQAKEHGHATA
jgi:hypothetical protein